ncbi:hypothetical protein [Legionella saoudiensis]
MDRLWPRGIKKAEADIDLWLIAHLMRISYAPSI